MPVLPPPVTPRIAFAKIMPHDLDDLVALDSDPEVMRFISAGVPTPRADYLGDNGLLARMMRYSDDSLGYFSARVDGAFIGWFHLRPSVFEPEIPELGYRLAQRYWRRGLATEGGLALCGWAFNILGFDRVDACAIADNVGSIAVMKKCGMTRVGSMKHPWVDLHVERYWVNRREHRCSSVER